jgi:peptidoglycan/LPS O-acetylase OafA/YrhL
MANHKFPSLNGLRGLSIIMVINSHCRNIFKNLQEHVLLKPFVYFAQDGQMGVNIFFIISGFLITSIMLDEETATKKISLKKFYIRRTLRIFPAYYFLLMIYFFLESLGYLKIDSLSWATAITYTKDFRPLSDWYTAHAWSLSIEEQFYFFWPFIFIAGDRVRKTMALSLILLVPALRIFLNCNPVNWISDFSIFTRIDAIAFGCIIALYRDKIVTTAGKHWNEIFSVSISMLLGLRYLPWLATKLHFTLILTPLAIMQGTIANILMSWIILYSVFGPKGIWYQLLNTKLLNYLGMLSYSIYLWQQLFTMQSANWFQQYPVNLFFILVAAICSYYFIEMPFLKLKSKF